MKHLLIILFLTLTCSAQKAEYDVVNDFLEMELKELKYDSIYVQTEMLDNSRTKKLYQQAYEERFNQNSESSLVWVTLVFNEWPFKEDEILERNPHGDKTEWLKDDFVNKDFVLKSEVVLDSNEFISTHLDKKESRFAMSQPIFSRNGRYAIFYFYLNTIYLGSTPTSNNGAVIMKKQNRKWIVVASIREAIYN